MSDELEQVLARLERVSRVEPGRTHLAVCPLHDEPATLIVRYICGEVHLSCQHGCTKAAILNALGLRHS